MAVVQGLPVRVKKLISNEVLKFPIQVSVETFQAQRTVTAFKLVLPYNLQSGNMKLEGRLTLSECIRRLNKAPSKEVLKSQLSFHRE